MATVLVTIFVSSMIVFGNIDKLFCKITGRKYQGYVAHWFVCKFGQTAMLCMRPFWSYDLVGRENLKNSPRPCVFIANHQSVTDILLFFSLNLPFRAIGKESTFKLPFIGTAVYLAKFIPIKRGDKNSAHESLRLASEVIEDGLCMFLYPEGTRSLDGKLLPFKMGAFVLADKYKIPVVPIIMIGASEMLRKHSFIPEFFHAEMKVLPHEYKKENESVEEFSNRIRDIFLRELSQN